MHLIHLRDFTCPFSALASERAARLEAAGAATVEWRAVQHLPDLPADGQPVDADLALEIDAELAQLRSMLQEGERFPVQIPAVRPSSELAIRAFAAADDASRSLRRRPVPRVLGRRP